MMSRAGSASVASSRTTVPLMATRPSVMRRSAPRRDVSPAWARTLFSLSLDMLGALSRRLAGRGTRGVAAEVGQDQLALDLRQIVQVAQPEGDEEFSRRLVEEGAARRFLPSRDAHEPALHEAFEHALGVHAADRIDFGPPDRLLVPHDR